MIRCELTKSYEIKTFGDALDGIRFWPLNCIFSVYQLSQASRSHTTSVDNSKSLIAVI